ncbi:MAG: SdrD B-like domain-containing protein [Pirellulaceae bacterium]
MGFVHYSHLLRNIRAAFMQRQTRRSNKALIGNHVEMLEDRRVFSVSPIEVGATFLETDEGGDDTGDRFIVTFEGGAEGTELSRVIIDGDQIGNFGNIPGLSFGDVFFDTGSGEIGADGSYPFTVVSSSGIESWTVSVIDGGTRLQIDFEGFEAGERFEFKIDVDEVLVYNPNDPEQTLIDPIVSGAEVQGTQFEATFTSDYHYDLEVVTIFYDHYDSRLNGTSLNLPADNHLGQRDRSAAAVGVDEQIPLPISISGTVFHDMNLDLIQGSGEQGISGVSLTLWQNVNGQMVNTGHTVVTDANGNYEFGEDLDLKPGTYEIRETQPEGYFSVGAIPGTVAGDEIGSVIDVDTLGSISIELGGTAAVDYDFAEALPAAVSGYVYHDRDNDGVKDSGEEGIGGVQMRVEGTDHLGQTHTFFVTTDANGFYKVEDMPPGTYNVFEVNQPNGFVDGLETAGKVNGVNRGTANNPGDSITGIFLGSGAVGTQYNFGEIRYAEIRGKVHLTDADGNCIGEGIDTTPLEGVVLNLYDAQGNLVATTTTDANGEYVFGNLLPGDYSIEEITPAGIIDGADHVGMIDGIKVGEKDGNDRITNISLLSGDVAEEYNFCEHAPAAISGTVYHDENNNGVRDSGEAGIGGVEVRLVNSSGQVVGTQITDAQGKYAFTGLRAGNYSIIEVQPSGWLDGLDAAGTIGGVTVGSATNPGDKISNIDLKWGDEGVQYDFGEFLPGAISGYVYADYNENCVFETGEPPIAGVKVTLLDEAGNIVATTTTDANGKYLFGDLPPGKYTVQETQPEGYFHGGQRDMNGLADSSVRDVISGIRISSGQELDEHNFCELPPGKISGYVFQDGEVIPTPNGQAPDNLAEIRDGQRDDSDAPIRGVVLELRDGFTGLPMSANSDLVLPGYYSGGTIRVTTDANGYYKFEGLKSGFYSVFEVHPDGYIDNVDTVGSTGGLAINPGVTGTEINTLAVDPLNDAIIRIRITPGQHSQENNFSEVLVRSNELPPPPTPPKPPGPWVPPPPFAPPIIAPLFGPPPALIAPQITPPYGSGAVFHTWHLSVVNAGFPRGNDMLVSRETPFWFTAATSETNMLESTDLAQAKWKLAMTVDENGQPVEIEERVFGLAGGIPVAGDFDGDGYPNLGIFYDGFWYIDLNGNGVWDEGDLWAKLGHDGDMPVVGDWDGDGKVDIGIYGKAWPGDPKAIRHEPGLPSPANIHMASVKNMPPKVEEATLGVRSMRLTSQPKLRNDLIDHVFHFGTVGDHPLVGDWSGDGIATIAVFRDGVWHLDMDGDGRWNPTIDKQFNFGQAGDRAVVGDFTGDGTTEIGVYRGGKWIIDTNRDYTEDATDRVFEMGSWDELPIVGDWNGDGIDQPGTYQPMEAAPRTAQKLL